MTEPLENGVGSPGAVPVSDESDETPPLLPSAEAAEAILTLLHCRAAYLVGMALALRYPTEADIEALLESRDFVDTVMAFAEIKTDMRAEAVAYGDSLDARAEAVSRHYTRALEALETLSDMLGSPVEDLVSVLVKR